MGLGISLVANKPARRWPQVFRRETDWLETVGEAATAVARNQNVDFLLTDFSELSEGRIGLNVLEEWLFIDIAEKTVSISARTSTCGPGYHALVCDLADHLALNCGLQFRETDDDFDETGYFRHRDFESLQREHAHWFQEVAQVVINQYQHEVAGSLRLTLPVEAVVPAQPSEIVLSPHGPVTFEFLKTIAELPSDALMVFARGWFPWWERTPSATDFRKMGSSLLWYQVPWHVPGNEVERKLMKAALRCFDLGKTDGLAETEFPKAEVSELKSLLSPEADTGRRPSSTGIGYRRSICIWPLTGNWTFELPGYWYQENDDGTLHFHFGECNIFVSTFGLVRGECIDPSDHNIEPPVLCEGEVVVEEYESDGRFYRLTSKMMPDPDTPVHLQAFVSCADAYLLMTFAGRDEGWRSAVPGIVKTIRRES